MPLSGSCDPAADAARLLLPGACDPKMRSKRGSVPIGRGCASTRPARVGCRAEAGGRPVALPPPSPSLRGGAARPGRRRPRRARSTRGGAAGAPRPPGGGRGRRPPGRASIGSTRRRPTAAAAGRRPPQAASAGAGGRAVEAVGPRRHPPRRHRPNPTGVARGPCSRRMLARRRPRRGGRPRHRCVRDRWGRAGAPRHARGCTARGCRRPRHGARATGVRRDSPGTSQTTGRWRGHGARARAWCGGSRCLLAGGGGGKRTLHILGVSTTLVLYFVGCCFTGSYVRHDWALCARFQSDTFSIVPSSDDLYFL